MKPMRWWPTVLLCLSSLAIAAPQCDPDKLLDRFQGELKKQDGSYAQKESFALQVLGASGHGKNLFDFIDAASGGSYAVSAKKLIDGKILHTTVLPGGVSRDRVERVLISVSERRPITDRLAEPAGKLAGALGAWQLGLDLTSAIQGDDPAKLRLVKAAYDRQFNALTAFAQTRNLRLAMGGAAVIDYLLTDFMQTTLERYDERWWRDYVAFHERQHKTIVGGPNSWTGILESGGHAAVERRLNSFWDNALENSAYNRTQLIEWRNDASAYARLQKGFAARYYRDYLHTSFRTYVERQAREASYEAYEQASTLCREMDAVAGTIQAAQSLLQDDKPDLAAAIIKGDTAGVRKALAAGADVNQSQDDLPMIWMAVLRVGLTGQPDMIPIIDLLLATGKVSTAPPPKHPDGLVYRALRHRLYEVVTKLIRAGFPFGTRHDGEPLLVQYGMEGHIGAMRVLLDAGIDPNQVRAEGSTALIYAARSGHLDAVRFLVSRGADPTRANKDGVTPLSIAEHRKHQAVADYLRGLVGASTEQTAKEEPAASDVPSRTASASPLIVGPQIVAASARRDWATVRELMRSRPDALVQCLPPVGGTGRNPASRHCGGVGVLISSMVLLNAVASGVADAALVGQLIAAHADPNHRTSQGVNLVLLAVSGGNAMALDLLLKAGADPNTPWRDELTPLHHAALLGNTQMIERLLAAGARPSPDNKGNMPGYYLYWAHQGDAQLASLLGYAKAQEYEARKHEPDFDWNGFAQAMLQGAAQMTAQMQQQRQPAAVAPRPAASGPSIPDSAFFQPLKPAAPVQQVQRTGTPQAKGVDDWFQVTYIGVRGYDKGRGESVSKVQTKDYPFPRVICGMTFYDDVPPSESFKKNLREASNPVFVITKNGNQEIARCSGR